MNEGQSMDIDVPLRVWRDGDVIVVHGDLDMATAPLLDAVLGAMPAAERIVLDMSDAAFVDSSGLSALVRAAQAWPRVTLRRPKPAVIRLLEITAVAPLFDVEGG